MKNRVDIRGSRHVRVEECGDSHPPVIKFNGEELYNANPECEHEVISLHSGVRCHKCGGWFCL